MNKTYTDAVETIILFIVNLESIDQKKFVDFAEEVKENVTHLEKVKVGGKPIEIGNNITSLKILENLNSYLIKINEGRIK